MISKPKEFECLMTTEEVADMLKCHPNTVRNLDKRGKIPRVKLTGFGVRYKPSSIQNYIDGREIFVNPKY